MDPCVTHASHIGKDGGHTIPAQDLSRDCNPDYLVVEFETAVCNRQRKQPVSTMTGGSNQKGSQLKRTIKAGLNFGAVIYDDRAIPESLFYGRELIKRCAKPG